MKASIILMLSIAPAWVFAKCGPPRSMGELTKPATIVASAVRDDAPAIYLAPSGHHTTLFFKTDDLLSQLRADLAAHPDEDASRPSVTKRLLQTIEAGLPLNSPVDARTYAQLGGGLYWRFEYLAADLMSAGKVLVDEDPPGDAGNPAAIVMVSESKGGKERARWFCTARGKELLTVNYFDQ